MNPWWPGLASIVASENDFYQNLISQDTITTVDFEAYDSVGGHEESLGQDTLRYILKRSQCQDIDLQLQADTCVN
jgi:hypothetical protein